MFLPPFHLWYLLSLFFWKTFLPVIKQVKFYLLISVIIALLVGLNTNIGYYLSLSRTITLFPFFILGSIISKETFYKIYAKKYLAIIGGLVCLIACSILIYNFNPANLNMIHWGLPYKSWGFSMLNSILIRSALYILAAILSAGFIALIPKRKTFYSKLGTRTLQIYILHAFMLGAFFKYFPIWNHSIIANIIILIFPVFLSFALALPIVEFLYNKLFAFINKVILINEDAVG
jgi:fucose 4-O-acetylase-like acetyltransferase